MGRRLAFGIVKGLVIGAAFGALMQFVLPAGLLAGPLLYVAYGLLGALVGALSGRAPWKPGAWIEGVLKGVFGIVVGCGLYALVSHFVTVGFPGIAGGAPGPLAQQPLLLGPALAMVYGTLVELDNTGESDTETAGAGVRVDADKLLASIPDEDEAAEARPPTAARKRG